MWHNIISLYLPIAIVAIALGLCIREFDRWEKSDKLILQHKRNKSHLTNVTFIANK